MAIYEVTGPDKRVYEVEGPSGASKEQVLAVLMQHLEISPPPKPRGGLIAAAKAGAAGVQQGMVDLGANLGLRGLPGAQQDIENLEGYKARTFAPESKGWKETPWQEFKETLGGSLPYMAAPLAAGVVGGLPAAGAVSAAQFTGSNLARQREEGGQVGQGNLAAAAAAAVPQAALDVVAMRFIPGVSKMLGVKPKEAAAITRQTFAQAAKDVTMATGVAASVEGVTETAQQYLERLQAGLSTMSPEAKEEYIHAFIGGAVLGGTLGAPGRMVERSGLKDEAAKEQRAKDAVALQQQQAEAAAQAQTQEAFKQTPQYASDVAQRWDALQARKEELKQAMKAVPPGEFARDDKAEAQAALRELVKSEEYATTREEYKRLRPQIAQHESVRSKLVGQQDPLAGRAGTFPESQAKPDINEVVARLVDDPQRAKAVINGEVHIPGLSPAENRAVIGAIQLQWKDREKQAKLAEKAAQQQMKAELATRQTDLTQSAANPEPISHDVSQFVDSTQQLEQSLPPTSDLEYMDQPAMEDMWAKALGGDKAPPQVSPDIKPLAAPDKEAAPVDALFEEYLAADDEHVKAGARKKLDAILKQDEVPEGALSKTIGGIPPESAAPSKKNPYARELVRLRDEQEAAYADLLEAIEDVRSGKFIGGNEETKVAGAFKHTEIPRFAPTNDTLSAASERRDALFKKAQDAKRRYVRAAVQEAETRRVAAGQKLDTDTALKNAIALTDKLDEIINRLTADDYRENVPLEERPFAKPKAALDVIRDDVYKTTREFVTPQHKFQRVESPLKRQFPETAKPEEPTTLIDRALQRKDLAYGVRKSLEKAKETIAAGNVSRDLLDAAKELADRAMRGERTRERAVMRDLNNAMKALADAQRDDGAQRSLPDMEPTAFERANARNFERAPEVRKAREALDAAKKLQADTEKWHKEKLEDLEAREKELERSHEELPFVPGKMRVQVRKSTLSVGAAQGKVPSQRQAFLEARQEAMDKWRMSMEDWHFGERIAAAEKRLRNALDALKRQQQRSDMMEDIGAGPRANIHARQRELQKEIDAAGNALSELQEAQSNLVSREEAYAKAMQDKHVQREQAKLKELEAALEKLRAEKAEHGQATRDVAAQRAAVVKAERQREDARAAMKRARDEWQRKLVSGLGLEGKRVSRQPEENRDKKTGQVKRFEPGSIEPVEPPDDEIDRWVKHQSQADRTSAEYWERVKRGKKEDPTTRAKGPVARGAAPKAGKNITQARGVPGKRDTVIENDADAQRQETIRANLAAEAIKGIPGTDLRNKESRGKLETDRAALQAEVAQLVEAKEPTDPKAAKAQFKKITDALTKLSEVEDALEPYRKLDALEAEDRQRNAKKTARTKKKSRQLTKIFKKLNEENADDARAAKAVRDLEEDADAFDDLSEFGDFDGEEDHLGAGASLTNDAAAIEQDNPLTGMSLSELAKWGQDNTDSPAQRALFKRLWTKLNALPEGKVIVVNMPMNESSGAFRSDKRLLAINSAQVTDQAALVHTVLHELTHAVTASAIDRDWAFLGHDINMLLKRVKEHVATKKPDIAEADLYGLENGKEFIAEAFSNPRFQALLKEVPSEKASVFSRFVRWVAKLLGFNNEQINSALGEAISLGERAMNSEWGQSTDSKELPLKAFPSVVVGSKPGILETLRGNMFGRGFRQQFVDMRAPLEESIKAGEQEGKVTPHEALEANYFMRLADQAAYAAGQFMTYGPVKILRKKMENGATMEYYDAAKGASMRDVAAFAEKASKEAGWPLEEVTHALTVLGAGARANAVQDGWKRLSKDPAAAKAEYDQVVAKVNANPQAKAFLDQALAAYKQVADGGVDFLVETEAISPQEGARLKKTPYIPFYRVDGDGEVRLFAQDEHGIRIGNIKDSPDLQQMLGDEKKVLPIWDSAAQNLFMISRMGLHNKATKETANVLNKIGFVSKMGKGPGPSNADTVHYKVKGESYFATIDSDTFGIPAKMIVLGMSGIKTAMPGWVRAMAMPANFLRKMITMMPSYAARQLIRDPLNAAIAGGVDVMPVVNSLKHMGKTLMGSSDEESDLMHGLIVSSNVKTGDVQDMADYARQVAGGENGVQKFFNFWQNIALQADKATRASVYEDSKRKGMNELEARFRAMEIQNFSRRGLSPTMQHMSMVIPFFNAQIQGIDVLYRAARGRMPFNEQLDLRRKLAMRGLMLAATTFAYAAMMQDEEEYRKARPAERYQNFFLPNPWGGDMIKIPIPFEVGLIFKALPEAVYDAAWGDAKAKEALGGLATVGATSIPGFGSWGMPAAISPAIQAAFGRTTWGPIETNREKQLEARERYRENTSEVAKWAGKYTSEAPLVGDKLSPIMLEHLVRGYTGGLGLALLHAFNGIFEDPADGEKVSKTEADMPLVGGLFQRKEGRYQLDRAYDRMNEIVKAQKTYKDMIEHGKRAEAELYRQEKTKELLMAPMAGMYRQQQGDLLKAERIIKAHPTFSKEKKEELLKRIRAAQNERAKSFYAATERTAPQ